MLTEVGAEGAALAPLVGVEVEDLSEPADLAGLEVEHSPMEVRGQLGDAGVLEDVVAVSDVADGEVHLLSLHEVVEDADQLGAGAAGALEGLVDVEVKPGARFF